MVARSLARLGLAALIALSALAAGARADEVYAPLEPLLIDLDGWTAQAPKGSSMSMDQVKMVNVTRDYAKGDDTIEVTLTSGSQLSSVQLDQDMDMKTDDSMLKIGAVDGYRVMQTYSKNDAHGSIMVRLQGNATSGALFVFDYHKLQPDEAMALAKKFDWKALADATAKLQ